MKVTTQYHLNILFNEQQNESPAARNLTNLFKISQISCFFVRFLEFKLIMQQQWYMSKYARLTKKGQKNHMFFHPRH